MLILIPCQIKNFTNQIRINKSNSRMKVKLLLSVQVHFFHLLVFVMFWMRTCEISNCMLVYVKGIYIYIYIDVIHGFQRSVLHFHKILDITQISKHQTTTLRFFFHSTYNILHLFSSMLLFHMFSTYDISFVIFGALLVISHL